MSVSTVTDIGGETCLVWECPGCECGHHVPVEGPRAWGWNGSTDAPTLTPSVLRNRGGANPTEPVCHLHMTDGAIKFLGDCTHHLAGQTVAMEKLS